jgi:hypothetical protein
MVRVQVECGRPSLAEELDAHGEGRVAGRRRVRAPEDRRAVAWSCWL